MKKILWIILLICPLIALADNMNMGGSNASNNLGVAANQLNAVIAFIYNILDVILYAGAAIMGVSGLLKYRLHRRNPQQIPLSTPVTELALAGVFIILAFLVQLSASHKTVTNPNLPNVMPQGQIAPKPAQNTYPY